MQGSDIAAQGSLMVGGPADLMTGLEELSMSCSTVTAGVSSRVVTSFMLQMARAASTVTMSFLCRRQLSRKS